MAPQDNSLELYGWTLFHQEAFEALDRPDLVPGRVAVENRTGCLVLSPYGDLQAEVTGRMLYTTDSNAALPKVGDWVAMTVFPEERKGVVHHVLPRHSVFSRKMAGKEAREQVVAANIDIIFIVVGLDRGVNPRGLERYLVTAAQGGAETAVVLNKTDLCDDLEAQIALVRDVAPDIPVLPVSAKDSAGIEAVVMYLREGRTFAFIGVSGTGKSTLINAIAGDEIQKTGETREGDSKGRHTTTRRELILVPGHGMLIDTPGMRELQLWSAGDGLGKTFDDIEELSRSCRYRDCTHSGEPGCAVCAALEDGTLAEDRYRNYLSLRDEMARLEVKRDRLKKLDEKRRVKNFSKFIRRTMRGNKKK